MNCIDDLNTSTRLSHPIWRKKMGRSRSGSTVAVSPKILIQSIHWLSISFHWSHIEPHNHQVEKKEKKFRNTKARRHVSWTNSMSCSIADVRSNQRILHAQRYYDYNFCSVPRLSVKVKFIIYLLAHMLRQQQQKTRFVVGIFDTLNVECEVRNLTFTTTKGKRWNFQWDGWETI